MSQQFTVVFEGNIRDFKGNPMLAETVFGCPATVGVGNAFEDADELREILKDILDAEAALEHAPVGWRTRVKERKAKAWARAWELFQ